jgi:hypothetical protein
MTQNIDVVVPSDGLGLSNSTLRAGAFIEGFNNDLTETDPTIAWPGFAAWTGDIAGIVREWGFPTRFKATHCSLIPKGPHRGRLLLWSTDIVVASADITAGELWSWQAWVILDLAEDAEIVCRNYLLPVAPVQVVGETRYYPSLFCSGHAWTEFGDLIVAGGNAWSSLFTLGTYDRYWVWNPSNAGGVFAPIYGYGSGGIVMHTAGHYADAGAWIYGGEMLGDRWYAGVKVTPRYAAAPYSGKQAVLFFGGSDKATTADPVADNPSWNTYEAYVVDASPSLTVSTVSTGLTRDTRNPGGTASVSAGLFYGPGTKSPSTTIETLYHDSLIFYPWIHQLTNGALYMSGMAWQPATLADHGAAPGVWTAGPGLSGPGPWQKDRMYGSAVMLPNHDGVENRVMRLGGQSFLTLIQTLIQDDTDTAQIIQADSGVAAWTPTADMTYKTAEQNVVISPDADIYVFGGSNKELDFSVVPPTIEGQFHTKPRRYNAAASGWTDEWELLEWTPAESYRDYHSTAMLLPDGRFFTGGGDFSSTTVSPTDPSHAHNPTASDHPGYDYEVFLPRYLRPRMESGATFNRPAIVGITGQTLTDGAYVLTRGVAYTVTITAGHPRPASHVVLMAPGSRTHHFDFSERYHKPTTQSATNATSVQFTVPATDLILPNGYYMLFLLDDFKVPSAAIWIKL